jgi:hypothetical protein
MRKSAQRLVRCNPWPGNEATALQLTELCLQHALFLQRSAHRAVVLRQSESAALLARASIETCLLGLYCQVAKQPMEEMRGSNAIALGNLMQYLVDLDATPARVVEIAQKYVGNTARETPGPYRMAKKFKEATGNSIAMDMYRRQYVPLSTLFAHANGLVLLRHVGKGARITRRPSYPWVRRSAVRASDVSVGILALAVAEKSDLPTELFVRYANAHIRRSLAPVFVMGVRSAGGSIQWRNLHRSFTALRAGKTYVWSMDFRTDPAEVRQQRVRGYLAQAFEALDSDGNEAAGEEMLYVFAELLSAFEPESNATE